MGTRMHVGRAVTALVLAALVAALMVSVRSTATAAVPGDPLCVAKPAVAASPTRILIIGDSLTSASAGDYTWRYFLWKHLANPNGSANPAATKFDFVGPSTLMVQPVAPYARTSDEYTCDFDKQNGAIPGSSFTTYLTPQGSSTVVKEMLDGAGKPGVLLVFLGAQDLSKTGASEASAQDVLDRAKALLAEARKSSSGVEVVFVTAPENASGTSAKVVSYNSMLVAQAPGWSTASSKVAVARTATGWRTAALTYDTIHPNPQGEVTIATDVAQALASLGIGSAPGAVPSYSAYVGPHQEATLAQPTVSGSSVNLSWQLPPGATVSKIQRRSSASGPWVDLGSPIAVAPNQAGPPYRSTGADTSYAPGTVYQYRVLPAKSTTVLPALAPGNPTFLAPPYAQYSTTLSSNVVTVPAGGTLPPTEPTEPPSGVPGAVSFFTAVPAAHAMRLTWGAATGATGYQLTWRTGAGFDQVRYVAAGTRALTVTGLAPGKVYRFTVQAVGSAADGPITVRQAVPLAYPLAKPAKPTLVALSGRRVKATWPKVTYANRYEVQLRVKGGAWRTVQSSAARAYTSGALVKGKTYQVRVRACDGPATGPYSAVAQAKAK